jgi:hypothetical protein
MIQQSGSGNATSQRSPVRQWQVRARYDRRPVGMFFWDFIQPDPLFIRYEFVNSHHSLVSTEESGKIKTLLKLFIINH